MSTRTAEPPKYITIICYSKIEGHDNIRLLLDLVARYNLARDQIYKHFVQEYGELKKLWEKYGIKVETYEDLDKINEKKERRIIGEFYEIAYKYVGNGKYAEGVATEVYATLKSINALRLKLEKIDKELADKLPTDSELEFNIWKHVTCIGSSTKNDKGNRNIKLLDINKAKINLVKKDITVPLLVKSRKYRLVLEKLINCIQSGNCVAYTAKLVLTKDYAGGNSLPIEVHITVPFNFYAELFPKVKYVSSTPYVAGHDINADRLNTVIVDSRTFRAVAWKTFWYDIANVKNVNSDRVWNEIVKQIRQDIDFCIAHRCFKLAFEDYTLLGDWKLLDCLRNKKLRDEEANWRKFSFRSSVVEKYTMELYCRGLPLPILVEPSGTTKIAEEIHSYFGWDIHTTSAYLVACFANFC